MADAWQSFYQAALEGRISHDGDPIFSAHIEATAADKSERGWKIRKLKSKQQIDATVAKYVTDCLSGGHDAIAAAKELISQVWDQPFESAVPMTAAALARRRVSVHFDLHVAPARNPFCEGGGHPGHVLHHAFDLRQVLLDTSILGGRGPHFSIIFMQSVIKGRLF